VKGEKIMAYKIYGQALQTEPVEEEKDGERISIERVKDTKTCFTPSRLMWFLVVVAVVGSIIAAIAAGKGLIWLFEIKPVEAGELGEIAVALAPLLALALAIERLIETVFDFFEQTVQEVAKIGSAGLDGLTLINQELEAAWNAANEATSAISHNPTKPNLLALEEAENRITKANQRIAELSKDPKYVSKKRYLSIWIGLLLGIIVAILSDTGIFELLQIGVPRIVDMIITGFVIGAGSGPMHSLVGILQGTKDTLEGLKELGSLAPLKQQIKDLQAKL
jgi:hypothetical protein